MPRHSSSSIRSNKASVSYKFPVFFFQGKISREEIAFICVAALASPNAVEKTFEVKILQLICKTLLGTTKLQKEIVAFYFILS